MVDDVIPPSATTKWCIGLGWQLRVTVELWHHGAMSIDLASAKHTCTSTAVRLSIDRVSAMGVSENRGP